MSAKSLVVRHAALAGAVSSVTLSLLSSMTSAQVLTPPSQNDRVLGLDISAWQGNISQTTWNNIRNVENRRFVFLRSSRGGTTGYYNQSNAGNDNPPGQNTLSQRYDDPYFVQNINRATAAGMLAGPYHFGRMDIIASTLNSNGIPNNGTDEANHFIEMAGAWMRPGYLLPTFDFEAGNGARTASELAQFAIDFSNRIYAVKGIRPIVYIGNNYSSPMNSIPESTTVVSAYPTLWLARWPNQADPNSIPVQTADPGDYTSTIYGPWDNAPNPADPWMFWQYASTGRLNSFNNGNSNLDFDVAHGNIEYVKDYQVPAIWISASDGNWTTLANWNSGETPVAPVTGPGQVPPVGTQTLPTVRLPGAQDNVDLNRPNENVTITLSSGAQTVRRFNLNERLNVTGGSLDASLTGQVGAGGTLSMSGGTVTFTQGYVNNGGVLEFAGAGTLNVGTLNLSGNVTFTGASGTGQILPKAGFAGPTLNLGSATRTLTVGEGSASTDLRVALPLTNGNLLKNGDGTLELTGVNTAFTGNIDIAQGHLLLTAASQLGTLGVRTNQSGATVGGTVRIAGTGLNFTAPLSIAGLGASTGGGALENTTGSNTWSGPVTLAGTQGSQGQVGLNQIGAATGTTLTLSGIIQNGSVSSTWAKIGDGDVVLAGGAANTYSNLTRLFGGRLIIEKDGALGALGSTSVASGNFFQIGNAASTLAFRSAGSLNYTTYEVLNTDGTGAPGFGQIDNLAGNNTFAGSIAFGGPVLSGSTLASTIGVTSGSLDVQGGLYARGSTGTRDITKLGVGTLIISGTPVASSNPSVVPLTSSTFHLSAGTLEHRGPTPTTNLLAGITTWNVNNGATLKQTTGSFASTNVNVPTGGTLRYDGGSMSITNLNISGGQALVSQGATKTLITNSLAVSSGGKLDLADNDLIVRSGSIGTWNGSAYTGITGLIESARNGGAWNGAGITTSMTDATSGSGYTSLGVATAAETGRTGSNFAGITLAASDILVLYTYGGDANLSGNVDVDDYGQIDFNAGVGGVLPGWFNGDFDYSGSVDVDDYGIIDFVVNIQGPPLINGSGSGMTVSTVPEPTLLAPLLLATLAVRRRRSTEAHRLDIVNQ